MPPNGFRSYRGCNAYVTGGSSGIGLATARLLAASGASVTIGGRRRAPLEAAAEELRHIGDPRTQRFQSTIHDVRDRDGTEQVVALLLERMGRLDVVINNAGATHPAKFLDTPPDVFDDLWRTNALGAINTTRAVLPSMIDAGGGRVAFVSSMAGFMGVYGYTAYCASKFALVGFVDALRAEVGELGIRLTLVHPPDTDTPMLEVENRIKPPETARISGAMKPLPAERVAHAILRAVERGRYDVVPGLEGTAVGLLHRHAPWAVRRAMDHSLRRYRRTR